MNAKYQNYLARAESTVSYVEQTVHRDWQALTPTQREIWVKSIARALSDYERDMIEQIKRTAREIPLGQVFDTGPLAGTSEFNASMAAAELIAETIPAQALVEGEVL